MNQRLLLIKNLYDGHSIDVIHQQCRYAHNEGKPASLLLNRPPELIMMIDAR